MENWEKTEILHSTETGTEEFVTKDTVFIWTHRMIHFFNNNLIPMFLFLRNDREKENTLVKNMRQPSSIPFE